MSIFRRTEPQQPSIDERAAALAARGQRLEADSLDRRGLQSAATEATAERERRHAALSRIISDPMAFASTPASDIEAAKKALLDAVSAEEKAVAALRDHEQKTGDLAERAQQLAAERAALHNERVWELDRADAAAILECGQRMADLQQRIVRRRLTEKNAGLLDFTWPVGVFDDQSGDQRYAGENLVVRSVWRDHVRLGIALAYPDLLPNGEGDAIAKQVADKKATGAPGRWFAQPVTRWDVFPFKRFGF